MRGSALVFCSAIASAQGDHGGSKLRGTRQQQAGSFGSAIRWSADPSYCLSVDGNSFKSGQNLVLVQCPEGSRGSMGQRFDLNGETGFLHLVADKQFCVASYDDKRGGNVYLEFCGAMSIVSWEYESGYFKAEHGGKCMAVEHNAGATGQNVLLWSCNEDGQGSYRMWNYDSDGPNRPHASQTRGSPIQWAPNPYYCLTVQDDQFTSGQNLVVMQCQEGYQGSMGQRFHRDGGFLRLVEDSRFCIASDGYNDGANIYLEFCSRVGSVSWEYKSGYFKDVQTGKCMAVEHNNGASGQNVLLWSCNDDDQGSYRMWKYLSG